MDKKLLTSLASGLFMLGLVGVAEAGIINYSGMLDGLQEATSNASPGMGNISGTYDDTTGGLTWSLSWSDLLAPATAAHFHFAPLGVSGPVRVTIPSVVGLSGIVNSSSTITAMQAAELLAGNWYVNIHSSQFPGGEIRGQVFANAVPEPATVVLFSLGLATLVGASMRRERSAGVKDFSRCA